MRQQLKQLGEVDKELALIGFAIGFYYAYGNITLAVDALKSFTGVPTYKCIEIMTEATETLNHPDALTKDMASERIETKEQKKEIIPSVDMDETFTAGETFTFDL